MAQSPIDVVMKAYATDAVAVAARRGLDLDYSERSLGDVDALLARESFIGTTPREPESPEDEEQLWVCAKLLGAYVGEVVVRVLNGHWAEEPGPGGVRPAIIVEGVKGFPIDKVWKRLTVSEFDTVGGYCRVLKAIVDRRHPAGG